MHIFFRSILYWCLYLHQQTFSLIIQFIMVLFDFTAFEYFSLWRKCVSYNNEFSYSADVTFQQKWGLRPGVAFPSTSLSSWECTMLWRNCHGRKLFIDYEDYQLVELQRYTERAPKTSIQKGTIKFIRIISWVTVSMMLVHANLYK